MDIQRCYTECCILLCCLTTLDYIVITYWHYRSTVEQLMQPRHSLLRHSVMQITQNVLEMNKYK